MYASYVLGIVVSMLPTFVFGYVFMRPANEPRDIIHNFYKGEALKFLALVPAFLLCLSWSALEPLKFFVAFIVTQFLTWIFYLLCLIRGKYT